MKRRLRGKLKFKTICFTIIESTYEVLQQAWTIHQDRLIECECVFATLFLLPLFTIIEKGENIIELHLFMYRRYRTLIAPSVWV